MIVFSSAIITDNQGGLLMALRKEEGKYGFPGGKLKPGESAYDCLVRETFEETGLIVRGAKLCIVQELPCRTKIGYYWRVDKYQCHGKLLNKEPEKHQDWLFLDLTSIHPDKMCDGMLAFLLQGYALYLIQRGDDAYPSNG